MKTNFSMLFYTKKQRNYQSGLAPIYLRITVDGKRSEVTGKPNMHFSPNGKWINFNANFEAAENVYAVEINKNEK